MDKGGKMKKRQSCAKSKIRTSATGNIPVSFIEQNIFQCLLLYNDLFDWVNSIFII